MKVGDGHLTREFIERQRHRLERVRRQLLRDTGIEGGEQARADAADPTPRDYGDAAEERTRHDLDDALHRVAERRLRNVERALQKIADGTYGLSDDSGEPIPRERLESVPEAAHTVEEESRLEERDRPAHQH